MKFSWKTLNLIGLFFLNTPWCFSFEKPEMENPDFLGLKAFTELTKDLNQVSYFEKVPFRIREIGQKAVIVSQPQLPLTSKKGKGTDDLPPLSTDPSKINPVDIEAFGFGPFGVSGELELFSTALSANTGLLPIPQARVVSPVGEQRSTAPTESPLKTIESLKNSDVITELTPKNTRFGKDRYDDNFFKNQAPAKSMEGGRVQMGNSIQIKEASANSLLDNPLGDVEQAKKQEQEARESFQQTMKEFAERTEDQEVFRLVDYYDLKNVLAKHESILSSFENDDIDERFVKNAKTIFDRFGDKDNAIDKKPFEKFLKRMEPQEVIFRNQNNRKNPFSSNRPNHREERSENKGN